MSKTPDKPRDIVGRIARLDERRRVPLALVPDTAWQPFVLLSGWSSLHLLPAGVAPAGYHKDGAGYVYLRGGVRGTLNQGVSAVLPVGYRPEFEVRLNAYAAGHLAADVVILPDGTMNTNKGAADWLSLDSLFFRAFQ
jgi:hypothetical protein